jgi:hypothetical protein
VEDILKKELGSDEDDADFEPELVGGYAGTEAGGDTDSVADGEAEEDGPEDVLDVRDEQVWIAGVNQRGSALKRFAEDPDPEEEGHAGE